LSHRNSKLPFMKCYLMVWPTRDAYFS
jgi:hypothetical protein